MLFKRITEVNASKPTFPWASYQVASRYKLMGVTDRRTLTRTRHHKMLFLAKHYRWFTQRTNKKVPPTSPEIVFDTVKAQVRPFHLSYGLHASGLGTLHFTALSHQPF